MNCCKIIRVSFWTIIAISLIFCACVIYEINDSLNRSFRERDKSVREKYEYHASFVREVVQANEVMPVESHQLEIAAKHRDRIENGFQDHSKPQPEWNILMHAFDEIVERNKL